MEVVPRRLLRDYFAIFFNPRFQRLAAASTFNFAALFLYIASAPAFVLDLLRINGRALGEADFGWFFVPTIGGMVRSEEHTSELQSLMSISYAVLCLQKNT